MEEATSARSTQGGYSVEVESFGRRHQGNQEREGLSRVSGPSNQRDSLPERRLRRSERGFQGPEEDSANYCARVGGRVRTVSDSSTRTSTVSWKVIAALFLVGTLLWAGT